MKTMSVTSLRGVRRTVWAVVAVVVGAVLLAACASSSGGGSAPPAAAGGSTSASAAAALTIETHSGPLGTFLTDGKGNTLYMFASDTSSTSTCSGQCVVFWPPLAETTTPSVAGGASAGDLGAITRADGTKQVTYNGHPLYYFKEDTAAGDTKGQGNPGFGAKWWVLSPKGAPIEGSASPAAPSPAPSSSSSSSTGAAGGWA
jgi:predicted lipoprotein with Yx(FWY)xxD motif